MLPRKIKPVVFIACISILSLYAMAQENSDKAFKKGSWELNLSGDLGSQSSDREYESGVNSSKSSSDNKYFQLHIIPGIYIADGLSFEPELDFLFVENVSPSYSLIPNLSYTYRPDDESNIALYLRGGYGLSNSYNMFGVLLKRTDALDIGVLNLGGGMKLLISENFCLRTELNYRRSSYTVEESSYGASYKLTQTLSNIRLLLGFSVIL